MWQGREGRWILGTVAGLALLLFGFVVLLWRIGLFDLPKDDTGAKAFAAVLALVGGLVAAVLTFVGVLLKLAFDARTLQSQREAEERLKIDTCIRAVGLMNTASANEAGQSQKAGALFALANLGQVEFALALLEPMWSNHEVASPTAVWLIDKGLQDPKENIQRQAALLLSDNAEQLRNPTGDFEWPDCLDSRWMPKLNVYARESILEGLLRLVVSSPIGTWKLTVLNNVIVNLYLVMENDDNPTIQAGAILALDVLLGTYDVLLGSYKTYTTILYHEGPIDTSELRRRIAEQVEEAKGKAALATRELVDKLKEWARPVPAPV